MTLTLLEIVALGLLGAAVLLSLLRLILGPTAPDRVVAADTLAVITTSGLVILAALLGSPLYLDVALIYGTLAFVGVVAIARTIEGNG
ncbi:MAG: cation:proton antiporter [gamma proteobacterium symbiont of Stewartia floridana]|uniref:Cation:proton antiporter n=3 Tax=Candidatus Thiodiazotropha TaxID=1913444 RepID=A0A1E2UJS5_9GAMM|nr:monovalent cation/H+ antiporter complex subunit F [Candidatus Thiodiazotropha endoloripes]MCG7869631.1 monovalent cation/H+ antiporter complex subunit F [Candidatus Thiodiazotropha taylori]MCG7871072.1 monovalent cation/H+ antiporter complex subunit F [Candidatus Thiodiazotropha lotti]MCG7899653.1 monovalent cation/H+ antiporter complex subunit F [Candidatus Thiodiazotropha weberae]MCG7963957.1 monovalent cation/H+ antiporter complex subunit F [Candidatus Thiodiazotropha endolucinida]RLW524